MRNLAFILLAAASSATHARDSWTAAPRIAHSIARQAQAVQPALPPVAEFVQRQYVEGIPYELASRYGPADAQALLPMLHDQAFKYNWSSIVMTLGAIGSTNARDILIQFLEEGTGDVDATAYRAKSAVPMALGWMIFKKGDAKALSYLEDGAAPSFWPSRVKWTRNGYAVADNLSCDSVLGLGLTGDASARAFLVSLKTSGASDRIKAIAQQEIGVLDTVKAKGLAGYYKR